MAHLLVVDDERSICELLEITFRKEGHRVEVATNGEAAKRRARIQIFDIVISDIRMPDMDGVELLRYCKEISPATTFLLITGVPTVETAIAAVNSGADRYVIKGDRLLDELRPAVQQVDETLRLEERSGLSAAGTAPAYRPRQHHRHQPQDARHFRPDPEHRAADRAAC